MIIILLIYIVPIYSAALYKLYNLEGTYKNKTCKMVKVLVLYIGPTICSQWACFTK